jgi:hypothetical protein
MSSREFDTLRVEHPDEEQLIRSLETLLTHAVRSNPSAVIDDSWVTQQLRGQQPEVIQRLLMELVREKALRRRLFWVCPNFGVVIMEADEATEFPDLIDSEVCGERHYFDIDEVEVSFVATEQLSREATTVSA